MQNLFLQRNVDSRMSSTVGVFVEPFFVMSGLLVTLSLMRQLDRSKGYFNIFRYYFHRFMRLIISFLNLILRNDSTNYSNDIFVYY